MIWSGIGARLGYTTGVGKHVKNMTAHLRADPGWDVRVVLAGDQSPPESAHCLANGERYARLPLSRRRTDLLWTLLHWPAADAWLPEADWIYCPKEKFVPVRDIRVAVTVHDIYGFDDGGRRETVADRLRLRRYETMLASADLLFAVSNFTRERLLQRFDVDAKKVVVVGNGVEEGYFAAAELDPEVCRESAGMTRRYLLCVGGLRRKKGAESVLRFAHALAGAASDTDVVVVGPVEPEYAAAAAECPNLRVIARGFPDEEMIRLLRGASVAVSLSAYEGFGIPLIEAMAAGVPVVAANRSAFPEVAGDAAVLVDPSQSEEVAGVVRDLIHDTGMRSEWIDRGRRRAQTFRWQACAERASAAMRSYDCER